MSQHEREESEFAEESQTQFLLIQAERAEAKRHTAFKSVMATAEGRRWIWWLLDRCGVFRTSFTGDETTYFNEGTRNVGLMVIADINALCPEYFATMMTEAKDPL
jgi:hypothetical protein